VPFRPTALPAGVLAVWWALTTETHTKLLRKEEKQKESVFPLEICLCQRIESPGVKGMASQQTTDRETGAAKQPVFGQCINRVFGTSRSKTTSGRQPRRHYELVQTYDLDRKTCRGTHDGSPKSASSSCCNASKGLRTAEPRGLITMSNPIGMRFDRRTISRTRRLILFLS